MSISRSRHVGIVVWVNSSPRLTAWCFRDKGMGIVDMWFLITWTTYGHWVPGDARGFRTYRGRKTIPPPRRYAGSERAYNPVEHERLREHVKSRISGPIRLNKRQMRAACDMIIETASGFGAGGVVAAGSHHVHILASFPPTMTTGFFCNRVKSRSSLRLSEYGLKGKVWARRNGFRTMTRTAPAGMCCRINEKKLL